MVDFRKIIAPTTQADTRKRDAKVMAFQTLPSDLMAEAILEVARKMVDNGMVQHPLTQTFERWAVYRIIPELAVALKPDVVLRDSEIMSEQELRDRAYWWNNNDQAAFLAAAQSISGSSELGRISYSSRDDRVTASALLADDVNMFTIAANKVFPGRFKGKVTEDRQEPLPGFYVIGTNAENVDVVLHYCEDLDHAISYYNTAVAVQAGSPMTSSAVPVSTVTFAKRVSFPYVELSLQNFGAEKVLSSRPHTQNEVHTAPTI
jgi:hypothetical protein